MEDEGLGEIEEEPWKAIKARNILAALASDPVDIKTLRQCAISKGGLLNKELRQKAWPKLLGVNVYHIPEYKGDSLHKHKERAQVMLDVKRCGRRIPEGFSDSEQTSLQDKLAGIILRMLASNGNLCYYQGLHDVTLTLLLTIDDENITFALLNTLVQYHLRDFVDSNMNYTKQVISYISPLLSLVDDPLQSFITRSECQYYFSLSWLITWFSHDVSDASIVDRLFDFFMATHPIMPVYCSAALILSRRDEVLGAEECEMSTIHGLLSTLSKDINYERIIEEAVKLYRDYPVSSVAKHGRLRINDSYLNYSNNRFERLVKRQRPDHILKDLPAPSTSIISGTSLVMYSSIPIIVGVAMYWFIKYDYHRKIYRLIF